MIRRKTLLFVASILVPLSLFTTMLPPPATALAYNNNAVPKLPQAKWTFMVYLDGDNNLEAAAIDDFLEMSSVGSDSNVNIVVQFDRIDGYDSTYGDWVGCKRFYITPGMTPDADNDVPDLEEVNMGDPQTVVDFVQWSVDNYPADNYALIFWNHGGGWRNDEIRKEEPVYKAVCWDDTNEGDRLYMDEVQTALSTINGFAGPMHLIGFDACLMGMVEVAYEIRSCGSVMVGSEEIEPGGGWPYDLILNFLTSNPGCNAVRLGRVIVNKYYQSYGNDETQSAIRLGRMNRLAGKISAFARTMRNSWNNDQNAVKVKAQEVIDQLDKVIIHEQHGSSRPDSHGLAIYFPATQGEFDPDYNGTVIDFPADRAWEEFLADYYSSMGGSWIESARSSSQEFYDDKHIDLYDFCQGLIDYLPTTVFYNELLVTHDFIGGGVAQGWNMDDESWLYALPFSFPFYGNTYDSVYVCSNGFLDFTNSAHDFSNSTSALHGRTMIAPLWDDLKTNGIAQSGEDIYIHQPDSDSVCIRWRAETWSRTTGTPVNVEVILNRDGTIQFNYGSGNGLLTPTIGISRGDSNNYDLSEYDGDTTLENVDSDLFSSACTLETGELNIDNNWQAVSFTQSFADPVVVAKPVSHNGGDPGVVRIKNVTPTGFRIRMQEWNYLNGNHCLEQVTWLAMEKGHWTLPDGTQVEAGTFDTNHCGAGSVALVNFDESFSVTPVLISSVMTCNGGDAVSTRNSNVSTSDFGITMQEQQLNPQRHCPETLGYIAWEPGSGTVNGVGYEVALGGKVNQAWKALSYGLFSSVPGLLVDMQTLNGGDVCNLRYKSKTTSGVKVRVKEEKSKDDETNHAKETVGYIALH